MMTGASSLDFLSGTTNSATATISSGQVMPDVVAVAVPAPIPEPATILLIGIAVIGLAVGFRCRSAAELSSVNRTIREEGWEE
jgi:PEP-CTERM motif